MIGLPVLAAGEGHGLVVLDGTSGNRGRIAIVLHRVRSKWVMQLRLMRFILVDTLNRIFYNT